VTKILWTAAVCALLFAVALMSAWDLRGAERRQFIRDCMAHSTGAVPDAAARCRQIWETKP
jgi:hypothetical protein